MLEVVPNDFLENYTSFFKLRTYHNLVGYAINGPTGFRLVSIPNLADIEVPAYNGVWLEKLRPITVLFRVYLP